MQIIFLFLLKNASCLSDKERIFFSSLVWVGDYKKNIFHFFFGIFLFSLVWVGDYKKHISESISLWPVTEAVSAKRGRKVNTGREVFCVKTTKKSIWWCKKFRSMINCFGNMRLWSLTTLPVTSSKFHWRWSPYSSLLWLYILVLWRVWPIQDQTSVWGRWLKTTSQ